MAYQGFTSGDADQDAFAVRLFANQQNPMILIQSFSKNFGLYGERIGSLSVLCDSKHEVDRVLSQLKVIARPLYSNPVLFGSRIVSTVLGNSELKKLWMNEVKGMAERLKSVGINLWSYWKLMDRNMIGAILINKLECSPLLG